MNSANIRFILDEVKRYDGDLSKVARRLGLNYKRLQNLVNTNALVTKRYIPPKIGKKELRPYIIATKHINNDWSLEDRAGPLEKARKDYDRGVIEMYQARDGNTIIQYAVPRHKKIQRTPYFSFNEVIL